MGDTTAEAFGGLLNPNAETAGSYLTESRERAPPTEVPRTGNASDPGQKAGVAVGSQSARPAVDCYRAIFLLNWPGLSQPR